MCALKLIEVWSDLKHWHLLAIQELPLQYLSGSIYRHMAGQMKRKCKFSLEKKLDYRPCDVVDES